MRTTIAIIFTVLLTTVYAQIDDYKILLDSAKTLFKDGSNLYGEEYNNFNYYPIVSILEKIVEVNPSDAEARYFLGYTYSQINSRHGETILSTNLELLYKTSEQFEEVIRLTPKYTGENIILDPYSKLAAEWGTMATVYWYNNKIDSAIWAFKEGRKRYGFGDFILELHKNVLDACTKNAILISSGDNTSYPLWYLQIVENYRTDITVVDINLLNTKWYPLFLSRNKFVTFDLPYEVLDTIEYKKWTDSVITINNFSWTVKPSYYDLLLRGDRVFLSLLNGNKFERDLFFTTGFSEKQRLNLKKYLFSFIVVDKLSISNKDLKSFENDKKTTSKILNLAEHLNLNSDGELALFNIFRCNLLFKINNYLDKKEKKKAKKLMKLLDEFANEKKYLYPDENWEKYINYLN
jgi:hypothetical protein